jgi:hypothetical protein
MSRHASQKVYFLIYVRTRVSYVRTPLSRNPFLTYFRIFRTNLNGLLGSVSLRIPVENFSVLKEYYLGVNKFMYFS